MTRKELRDYVDSLRTQDEISYDVYSGLIDGIDTLEQEPCDDCISRQEAIDVVRKWFDKIQLNGDICLDGIVSLPPVTPQSKMGKWINNKCDKCGASRPPLFDNYCPKCGAKMGIEYDNKIRKM